jgi:flagellar motor switch protein FliN/FliY
MRDDDNTLPPEDGQDLSGQDAADALFNTPELQDFDSGPKATTSSQESDDFTPLSNGPKSRVEELDAVYDVPIQISAVLGRAIMPVNQLLKLGRGAIVQLDKRVGEAIEIFVNNKLVARGEVVVVDERLGITMTEIIKSDRNNG